VSDIALYSIRSGVLNQWIFLEEEWCGWCFGVLVTAQVRIFWIAWRRFIWVMSMFRKRECCCCCCCCYHIIIALDWLFVVAVSIGEKVTQEEPFQLNHW